MSSRLIALIGLSPTARPTVIAGLIVMQTLLTIACALVLRQNYSLRNEVSLYQALAAPPIGRDVPPITGVDWTGAKRQVAYDDSRHPTLIYTFSKDCVPCISNWAAMRAFQELSPERLRIVYINTVDALTDDYLREHRMDSAVVFSRLDSDSAIHYRGRATPQSQLVDRNGRVVWTKIGKFSRDDVADLLALVAEHRQVASETRGVQQ